MKSAIQFEENLVAVTHEIATHPNFDSLYQYVTDGQGFPAMFAYYRQAAQLFTKAERAAHKRGFDYAQGYDWIQAVENFARYLVVGRDDMRSAAQAAIEVAKY